MALTKRNKQTLKYKIYFTPANKIIYLNHGSIILVYILYIPERIIRLTRLVVRIFGILYLEAMNTE